MSYRRVLFYLICCSLIFILFWSESITVHKEDDSISVDLEFDSPMAVFTPKSRRATVTDNPDRTWKVFRDDQLVLYAYSAFYDDRDTGDGEVVRVIVVAHKLDKINLFCVYNYTDGQPVKKIPAQKPAIGAGWSYKKRTLREYVLFCSCSSLSIPTTVTIVTNTTSSVHRPFVLPVERPERATIPQGFVVCPAVLHDHLDPMFLVEWLEMLRLLGVDKVTVYNISLDEPASSVLRYYYDVDGFVELRQSPYFVEDERETRRLHQSPAINDCYFRNMYRYEKIIVIDADEIIVPRREHTYSSLIQSINKKIKNKPWSYEFRNEYYFLDMDGDPEQPQNLRTLYHRKHVQVSKPGYSVKSIQDPNTCTALHNHYCWRFGPKYSKDRIHKVDPKIGTSQHYKTCHFSKDKCEEMMKKEKTESHMLRYKSELIERTTQSVMRINKMLGNNTIQ